MQRKRSFFCTFADMKHCLFLFLYAVALTLCSCHQPQEHKTVICIPVYGQSLALGEEAIRITDFDSLSQYANGRIVTEKMDHDFGYFEPNTLKRNLKKITNYQERAFELSVYSMAELLADNTGNDTLICIFPGGQGATDIAHLGKGSEAYQVFINDITTAYHAAHERGWDFLLPAICWMQGESDIIDYPDTDYRQLLLQFTKDINKDIKEITNQQQDIHLICYQTNPVSKAKNFNPTSYYCPETTVPQTLLELVRDSSYFHASGPIYPYDYAREAIHLDGKGQRAHGKLVGLAALDILHQRKQRRALLPLGLTSQDNEVIVHLNVPTPPLCLDTLTVKKVTHYGFSVITPDNRDIAERIIIEGENIHILCTENPVNVKVRYAVNGEPMKSGRIHGPRGNLCDAAGHWCYQFDMLCK